MVGTVPICARREGSCNCPGSLVTRARGGVLGVGLSSADQCSIADTAWQYCLGSAPDSPTRSLTRSANDRLRARADLRRVHRRARARRQRPRRPGVWSASRGNTAWLYRQYCTGRAEDLGRLGRVNASSGACRTRPAPGRTEIVAPPRGPQQISPSSSALIRTGCPPCAIASYSPLLSPSSPPRRLARSPKRPRRAADSAAARNTLPLKPARSQTFTTTKGTWISLDVSPDGRTHRLRPARPSLHDADLRRKATAITSGLAYDAQPRFSPDGKRIVFVSDRSGGDNLWIMSLDKKDTVQLTTRQRQPVRLADLDPRRQVRRRVQEPAGWAAAPSFGCTMSKAATGSRSSTARRPRSESTRRRVREGSALHLVRRADGRLAVQRHRPAVRALRLRPRQRQDVADVHPRSARRSGRRSRRTASGSSTARGTRPRPASAFAISTRRRRTGSPSRCSATTSSRARRSTSTRATRSRRTRKAIVVSYGGEIWRVPVDKICRDQDSVRGRPSSSRWAPRCASPIASTPRRSSRRIRCATSRPRPTARSSRSRRSIAST